MCYNTKDSMFQHVMNMVQNAIAFHLKDSKEVHNFAANHYKNEWYIFNSKYGNKEFADKLKLSCECLKKKNKLSRTFTEWMCVK